jgi:N-acetylglutamate synthase-like GNAT family acetyltransferase
MNDIIIRSAVTSDVNMIHEVLVDAFSPYKEHYTQQAYDMTVCARDEVSRRIEDKTIDVLVAVREGQVVGTAALHYKEVGKLYLSSMVVNPVVQGKGIGYYLLKAVEERARDKGCSVISLECCEFLKMAIALYRRMGYERTGHKRPYYGVEVFEMQKRL